jgi:hypothetical protein
MKNLFISNLNKKDVFDFTSDFGLFVRRKFDKKFKSLCNIFTNANIIRLNKGKNMNNDEYFRHYSTDFVDPYIYDLKPKKNNIVVERYPELDENESYIFVGNHSCPEDIETMLNIIDRNAYLVLGSIDSLQYNPEMYLLWLNGMIPFDILDKNERQELMLKMERVIEKNSILIYPEGSHNFSPNKLINNLYDGPVNLALNKNKKIILMTLIRDNENNVSYVDASNPIDISKLYNSIDKNKTEKEKVKIISRYLRDKMATSVYCMSSKHIKMIKRRKNDNIESKIRQEKIDDAFKKLHWNKDVFEAEYLTKKTSEEKEYEDVLETMSNLRLNLTTLKNTLIETKDYIIKNEDVHNKDVVECMKNELNKRNR